MEFHLFGYVHLVLRTSKAKYLAYFQNEYGRINELGVQSSNPQATITVHIVGELPPTGAGDIVRKVHFKGLFWHRYLVRGLMTNDVHLYFKTHPVGELYVTAVGVFLQAQVLEPIIYLKLLEAGVLLMHSAGVADDGEGYIFPAHGGTGKTSLSLGLVAEGFMLLGDDLVLIDTATGMAYPYPRPLHLFTYNLTSLEGSRIPVKVQVAIRFKNFLRYLLEWYTGEEFLIATRAHVDQVYEGIKFSPPVKYRKITFLKRSGPRETVSLANRTARETVARRIIASADLNTSLYDNILSRDSAAAVRRQELEVVIDALKHVERIDLINARKIDLQRLAGFAEELRS